MAFELLHFQMLRENLDHHLTVAVKETAFTVHKAVTINLILFTQGHTFPACVIQKDQSKGIPNVF